MDYLSEEEKRNRGVIEDGTGLVLKPISPTTTEKNREEHKNSEQRGKKEGRKQDAYSLWPDLEE